jgi:hypothetical protein
MIYEATGEPIFNGDSCFGLAGPNQQEWGVKKFRTPESKHNRAMFSLERNKSTLARVKQRFTSNTIPRAL